MVNLSNMMNWPVLITSTIVFIFSGCLYAAEATRQYQEIIEKHFPGFIILSPSDIDYTYVDMSNAEVEAIKADAHFLLANFNNDEIPDFVAKVRDDIKRDYPKSKDHPGYEYYAGGTVACISKGLEEYQCEFLWKTATYTLPVRNYLIKIPKGTEMGCPYEGNKNPYTGETGVFSFEIKTDAVGDFRLMGAGDSFYIPDPKGGFFECIASD